MSHFYIVRSDEQVTEKYVIIIHYVCYGTSLSLSLYFMFDVIVSGHDVQGKRNIHFSFETFDNMER